MDKKDKPAGAGFFGTKELLKKYKKDTPGESVKEVYKDSGLGNKPINVSNNIKKENRDMKSAKEFLNDIIENVVNEETELDEAVKAAKNAGPFTIVAIKNGKVIDTFRGAEHNELKDVVAFVKANNKGAKISVEAKGGKIVHTEDVEVDEAKMIKVEVDPKKKIGYEVRSVGPGGKTTVTKRKDMPDKKDITDHAEMTEAKAKRITKLHGKYPKGTHFCATHVEHVDFGHGNPIHSQHATPDRFGDIDWYDVMFEHGIERGVPTDDMNILLSEVHENHDHSDGEELEEAEFDSKKSAEEIRLRTKYRMSKDGGKDGKPYSPEDMHGAMDSLQRKKARTSGVKRKGSKHPDNNPVNLKIGEAAGQNPLKTTFGGLDKAKDTASYKKYLDRVAVAKAKRDAQIKKEREDGIRSKYESVERVDELKQSTLRSYKDKAKKSERSGRDTGFGGETSSEREAGVRQVKKRVKGIDGATKRLVARQYEDVEQVDELDAKTLKSYIWKAKGKVQSDLNTGNHSPETNKRAKNVVKAKRRVGEDVEQVDEGSRSRDHQGSYEVKIKDKDKTVVFVDHEAGQSKDHAFVQVRKNGNKHSVNDKVNHKDVDKHIKRHSKGNTTTRVQVSHPNDDTSGWSESVGQVDELDVSTIRSYEKKGRISRQDPDSNQKTRDKRFAGFRRASARIRASRSGAVGQVDELKMPEKSKRGRATDPVIAAALKRGWKRADLKADGKLRRGDAEGAESHMTNARKRKIASRVEDVELDELKSSTLRSYATKAATDNQNRVMRQIANDPAPTPKKSMDKLRSRSASRQAALSRLDARSKRRDGDKTKLTKSLAREEVEQVNEMSAKAHYKTYQNKFIVPPIDRNRNPNREKEGLEGPYRSKKSGKVFYYDTKAGKYYDADSDIYLAVKDVMEASRFESVEYVEEAKVGDTVHLGHASKGGSGVKGKVVKIDGRNVHIKNDRGDTFKGPLDRVTVGEAIRFDAGHPDSGISGKVSGKGKRNRKAGGEVRVKYKGHPAYKDDSPGLPIRSRDIGRLIKTARRKDTKPHDSKNLTNPTLTRDPNGAGVRGSGLRNVRKEGTYDVAKKVTDKFNKVLDKAMKPVEDRAEKKFNSPAKTKLGKIGQKLFNSVEYTDEGMSDSAKRAAKILTSRTPKNVHNPGNPKKPSRGDLEARQREDERLSRREGVEDMTAAQERDAARRLKPTRATVAKVGLPSTDKERASYVKKHADEKGGKPGNTKARKLRDLKLRLRGNQ